MDLVKTAVQTKFSTLNPNSSTMKKKSTSRSAFLNLRVLFGLFVMLAGVFLALVSFGPATTGFAQGTTREQMTVALAQVLAINPPACVAGQEMFHDVPASNPFCPFIEELSRRGITGGCGGGNFCPGDPVSRQQMAAFLVKAQFPSVVATGVTITGHFAASGVASAVVQRADSAISFPIPFAAAPTPHIILPGGASTAACPGSFANPQAAPGQFCLYEVQRTNIANGECVFTGNSNCDVATEHGGIFHANSQAAGSFFVNGTWAATAQ
jgi:S-layer homology domain